MVKEILKMRGGGSWLSGYAVSSSHEEVAEKQAKAQHVQTYNAYKKEMTDPVFANRPFSCSGKVW